MRLETIHPKELGPAECARWRAHQRANVALRSPYLTPEWAQLIGAVRDDARICVIEGGDGFFGVQRLSRFAAMGLGAPIADYQGLIAPPDLRLAPGEICRAIRVGRIDVANAPVGTLFDPAGEDASWIAEVSGGRDLYDAALKQRRGEFVRQTDKKARKLEREFGALEFRARSTERREFETLIAWKNAQLRRSGQPEIWARRWVRNTLEACFEAGADAFGGLLFTLHARDSLIAAAFCLCSERVLHFWLLGHDTAYDAYSPGVQLARRTIHWAAEHGFAEVDFGTGDYQYKRQLSTAQRKLARGVIAGASWSAAIRQTQLGLRAHMERLPDPRLAALPGKAMRRLDLMRALA
ncbi:MAG TPA: GNAT family N-acetyltransferase [Candidatus Binatia bacterium]|nr:GNAT family N-acetyltransferase [Candidatus Binatia bacterium]